MGAYRAAVVTASGQNLIAQALADQKVLEITSAKTSSYPYPVGTNITGLTGLQDVEQSVIPFASQVLNENVAQVSVRFDNNDVTKQYPIHTIGLYARVDDGEEVLFSVIQAITPDEMPVRSEVSPSAFIYNIQHTIQNAAQITITVNPAGTATVQDIYNLTYPAFDDSGSADEITGFPKFLEKVKSKMNIFEFYRNFKAGMQFVLHAGQIVNNCVTDRADLPGSAAQLKVLMDLYTKLNSDLNERTAVTDLFAEADKGWNCKRIVRYNMNTLNTPYKSGITGTIDTGLAIISMSPTNNYGMICCFPEGGMFTSLCICKKTNDEWGDWNHIITNQDLTISISPTTNFNILDRNGHGWLNTFKATTHGIGSPGEIRTGEGLFENIVYSSNIQLQRWTVNGYGIMVRQKTGSSWQAWKGIPYI